MAPDGENTASSSPTLLRRRATRRAVLGGGVAAVSVVGAYAALGDRLHLLSNGSSSSRAAATKEDVRGDTDAIAKESVQISHLLRRTGFGVTPDEYQHYQSIGLKATIDELINFQQFDDAAVEAMAYQQATPPQPQGQQAQQQQTQPYAGRVQPVAWWLIRMANTKRPLQEKMVLFWHGLLTSQVSVVRDVEAMIAQNDFFRRHVFADFPTILKGISADPAMMVYLDMAGSLKQAPNENYARELMELYSLGVGNYSEPDVRQAARAFTGWAVPRTRGANPGQFTLGTPLRRPAQYDNGSKTFLGKTGNFGPNEVVDIITEQPASAKYIVRRLFSFFIYPEPSDAEIQPFVDVYTKSNKNIGDVVTAMLKSDVFYSAKAYRSIVKSPVEFAVSAIKALGMQSNAGQLAVGLQQRGRLGGVLGEMGQILFEPPNVAGWPGNGAWLNSSTLLARLNFLNAITGGATGARPRQQQPALQPDLNLGTASQALAHYMPLALDDNLTPQARGIFNDYAGGADAQLSPERLRGLVYLILGSPQFNLS